MSVLPTRHVADTSPRGLVIRHDVYYKLNGENRGARERLEQIVAMFLAPLCEKIEGVLSVELFEVHEASRPVHMQGGYQYCLSVRFANPVALGLYMQHPDHHTYCRLLLVGWMVKGTELTESHKRVAEVVDLILTVQLRNLQLVPDPQIESHQRVWQGEQVADMSPVELTVRT